jgi:vacuolar-type H+-ATPase subunit D/Vma8
MAGILERIKQKFSKAGATMDKYQEAITFAEAGEAEHALAAVAEQTEEEQIMQLLVVGRESSFSKEIVDYALDMAQRMSYEILALNTSPLSCDTFKLFANSRDQLCEEFKSLSEKNAGLFQQAAAEKGVAFDHIVMFSETEEALQEVTKKNKNIAFVVAESISDRAEARVEDGERLRKNLYVYSMV